MTRESVEIAIEGFSGPLDLLCHLVETRKMEVAKVKATQLVRIYGVYLLRTKKASINALAGFFFMAAKLLRQKTLALLPAPKEAPEKSDFPIGEEELLARLARYRPYRAVVVWLAERKAREERYFRHLVQETGQLPYRTGDPFF
ncbi:MAG: segregation/condensation protein A [Synergistaceae bacterium]|jgi:segregation and condensation protein A|nr:segregation/condensation protein A [Synergistaceae bacterium]